jgi:predicted GIY-YIG superfamily endonuclease
MPPLDWFVFYTYVLESISRPGARYIGHTSHIWRRLAQHNAGENRSTAKLRPWKIRLFVAFETRELARRCERYLKSGSGHAFANRHFWS